MRYAWACLRCMRALQTKMVDVVPSSAIGAIALQWYTKLKYMSKDSFGIVVGGVGGEEGEVRPAFP